MADFVTDRYLDPPQMGIDRRDTAAMVHYNHVPVTAIAFGSCDDAASGRVHGNAGPAANIDPMVKRILTVNGVTPWTVFGGQLEIVDGRHKRHARHEVAKGLHALETAF